MSLVVAIIIALFFFFGGCTKLGIFIAQTQLTDISLYVNDLLINAWPLGVSAILFALIDIRLNRGSAASLNDEEIQEVPAVQRVTPHVATSSSSGSAKGNASPSYFRIDGADVTPSQPEPQTTNQAEKVSLFATPPPFQKTVPLSKGSHEAAEPDKSQSSSEQNKEDSGELSFFKL